MPERSNHAEQILVQPQLKGLRAHLQPGEEPVLSMPAIWDGGQEAHSETCEVVITNQRLLGYYFRKMPREKLFLDAVPLSAITHVTFRQKSYEPIFRELQVKAGSRTIYIRAPRNKSETLYTTLRTATEHNPAFDPTDEAADEATVAAADSPVYGREEIRKPFDTSPLAILLLFVGGIVLEIVGAVLWAATTSAQIGLPLCLAGFLAAGIGIFLRRQNRRS